MSYNLILAYHVDLSQPGRGCTLTVAIEASTDGYKAYRRTFDSWPTETDIAETGRAGTKVTPDQAAQVFRHLHNRYNYEQ